jgi:hypothetical protein
MHADRIDSPSADPLSTVEQAVLMLLLDNKQCVWSGGEVQRAIAGPNGNTIDAQDALANLHGAGLVNVCGEMVSATRAASRMDELFEHPL